MPKFKSTMEALVKLTYDEVTASLPIEASIMSGIAQKPDMNLKVDLSIE